MQLHREWLNSNVMAILLILLVFILVYRQ
jgi:hypothetical protein